MTGLLLLWLPILLASVIVFVASSIIHMAPLWHKSDFPKMPNEDAFRAAVGPLAIPPGDYMIPRPSSSADMKSPEFKAKMEKGPVVMATVLPNGPMGMGQSLVLWFLYIVVISIFAGYVAGRALPVGSYYLSVFRFVGVAAFLGYSGALWQNSIWYKRAWSLTIKSSWVHDMVVRQA
jgi:hypothetical protein